MEEEEDTDVLIEIVHNVNQPLEDPLALVHSKLNNFHFLNSSIVLNNDLGL